MTYKTIDLINQYIKKFQYVNPCPTEDRTFKWTDVWFGYRESEYEYECGDSPYAKITWDENAREIDIYYLKKGENILSLSYEQTSKAKDGSYQGSLSHKETFSYIPGTGFINTFVKRTLQSELNLTNEETTLLNETFENEDRVKAAFKPKTKLFK